MFIVRKAKSGLFSDHAYLEAVNDGVLTRRWLDWDRLGASTLRSELWSFASGEVFTLRVPKGSMSEHQMLSTNDLEDFNLKSLKRLRSS